MLSISSTYYVPDMKTRLLSPQQICSQYGHDSHYRGNAKDFTINWSTHSKTVSINKSNNLPILYTAPGMSNGISIYNAIASGNLSPNNFKPKRIIPRFNFNLYTMIESNLENTTIASEAPQNLV